MISIENEERFCNFFLIPIESTFFFSQQNTLVGENHFFLDQAYLKIGKGDEMRLMCNIKIFQFDNKLIFKLNLTEMERIVGMQVRERICLPGKL